MSFKKDEHFLVYPVYVCNDGEIIDSDPTYFLAFIVGYSLHIMIKECRCL